MPEILKNIKSNLLDNKTTKQTVAKNTFWLAFIFKKTCTIVYNSVQ